MRHRHLDVPAAIPPEELGLAALDDLLERGDLEEWKPVIAAVRRDPWGALAERILHLVDQHPMYGTSALWRSWIEAERGLASTPAVGSALRQLRLRRGLTQAELAARLGMTQPEVSKLERRSDVRLSTLRSYVAGVGGRLDVTATFGDEEVRIE
jgi:predicted XRE-type DNA-binding protein